MLRIFSFLLVFALISGCDIFDKEEMVPGFIHITRADVETLFTEGAPSHGITDVHVFADEEFVGSFELPSTIAMLKNGPTRINISAGIRNNGIVNQRIIYPFYAPLIIDRDVIPGIVEPVRSDSTAVFRYFQNALSINFEDFEGTGTNIVPINNSPVEMLSQGDVVKTGLFSGKISLTEEAARFEAATQWELGGIPRGRVSYIEVDFLGNNPLELGVRLPNGQKFFVIGLNPRDSWTKVYIEMTPILGQFIGPQAFEIYLESQLRPGQSSAELYIDNLKFLYPIL